MDRRADAREIGSIAPVAGIARVSIFVVVALIGAACTSSQTGGTTTTTFAQTPVTTLGSDATTTTVAPAESTTSAPPAAQITPPRYQIVDRIKGDGTGDTVVVLLDPTSYDSLTDVDLFDIMAEVVELFPPISVIHIVDDAAAANVVANPDASDAEIQAIQGNYLARLDNGFTITYLGPFASRGTAILGS